MSCSITNSTITLPAAEAIQYFILIAKACSVRYRNLIESTEITNNLFREFCRGMQGMFVLSRVNFGRFLWKNKGM